MEREYLKDILPERIENYMREAADDLRLNEQNIREKSLTRSALGAKWCRYSFEQNRYLKKLNKNIEELRDRIKQKLFEKKNMSVTDADPNAVRMINMTAEKCLIQTKEYNEIKEQINQQEEIIRLIDETQKLVGMFGYDIKNALDVLKLENI